MTVANSLCRLKTLFCSDRGEKNSCFVGNPLPGIVASKHPTSGEEAVHGWWAKKREGGDMNLLLASSSLYTAHMYSMWRERDGGGGERRNIYRHSGKRGKSSIRSPPPPPPPPPPHNGLTYGTNGTASRAVCSCHPRRCCSTAEA